MAARIAQVDPELAQLNKRLVHRQMEAMGIRAGLRAGTDLHALGWHTPASRDYMVKMREGVKQALTARDAAFGDYRTGAKAR
jgi:enoyl-CoA hydratase